MSVYKEDILIKENLTEDGGNKTFSTEGTKFEVPRI